MAVHSASEVERLADELRLGAEFACAGTRADYGLRLTRNVWGSGQLGAQHKSGIADALWGKMTSCGGLATRLPQASEGRLPIGRKMPSCPTMRCAQAHSSQLSAFSV